MSKQIKGTVNDASGVHAMILAADRANDLQDDAKFAAAVREAERIIAAGTGGGPPYAVTIGRHATVTSLVDRSVAGLPKDVDPARTATETDEARAIGFGLTKKDAPR